MRPTNLLQLLSLLILPVLFSACAKDNCKSSRTYTYYVPVFTTKDSVRANIKSNAPRPVKETGKIVVHGKYIFLNEIDKGIHVIDNSNPAQPRNISFIDIPGNLDISSRGNYLYADCYTDLVTIDISNPTQVETKSFRESIFPHRYYGTGFWGNNGNQGVIIDWIRKDTTITTNCDDNVWLQELRNDVVFVTNASLASSTSTSSSSVPTGVGGSMARFTIINERLYAVNMSELKVFNISQGDQPAETSSSNVGNSIETLYPFKNKLFIGSQSGMFIYDISNPDAPVSVGQFSHARSCDPVIADDQYAYVTLRSGTECLGFTNQMDVLDISNPNAPVLKKTYQLNNPHGLAKTGNTLFVCDGSAGLKIYNAQNPQDIQLINTVGNMDAYDLILLGTNAIVVSKQGLHQYDITNPMDLKLRSVINVQ